MGVELQSAPYAAEWGSEKKEVDWRLGAEELGNHVLSVCPEWLVMVPGVGEKPGAYGLVNGANNNVFDGENLQGAKYKPVRLLHAHKLVYSASTYGPSYQPKVMPYYAAADNTKGVSYVWDKNFGFLQSSAPVVIGSLGGKYDTPADQWWHGWASGYAAIRHFGVFYAAMEPNHPYTGGLLADDWTTPNEGKLQSLESLPATDVCALGYVSCKEPPHPPPPPSPSPSFPPPPIAPPARPPPPPPTPPVFPGAHCILGRTALPKHKTYASSRHGVESASRSTRRRQPAAIFACGSMEDRAQGPMSNV